ncbi:protein phosphatase 1 regulatory inhibitor subunit PPP1R7 [Tanacetum coccineum]|uniref:Protein phosphatase 1 regulatory inhibitor subunit PPP1R7 n=1 Tax=Tanacetum coccineum TaxID=301880 RepID=A0ABQ5F997_9ASTR
MFRMDSTTMWVSDVSSNKLAAVEDIEKMTCLEDLWFNDNQPASIKGIVEAVSGSREKLTTIYLEHNPCHDEATNDGNRSMKSMGALYGPKIDISVSDAMKRKSWCATVQVIVKR